MQAEETPALMKTVRFSSEAPTVLSAPSLIASSDVSEIGSTSSSTTGGWRARARTAFFTAMAQPWTILALIVMLILVAVISIYTFVACAQHAATMARLEAEQRDVVDRMTELHGAVGAMLARQHSTTAIAKNDSHWAETVAPSRVHVHKPAPELKPPPAVVLELKPQPAVAPELASLPADAPELKPPPAVVPELKPPPAVAPELTHLHADAPELAPLNADTPELAPLQEPELKPLHADAPTDDDIDIISRASSSNARDDAEYIYTSEESSTEQNNEIEAIDVEDLAHELAELDLQTNEREA
jgi:hypothetical protein